MDYLLGRDYCASHWIIGDGHGHAAKEDDATPLGRRLVYTMSRMETGTTELSRSVNDIVWRHFRLERSFQWKGVKAASEYAAKEQATRLLTAKLRAERLAREAKSAKREQKKAAKA